MHNTENNHTRNVFTCELMLQKRIGLYCTRVHRSTICKIPPYDPQFFNIIFYLIFCSFIYFFIYFSPLYINDRYRFHWIFLILFFFFFFFISFYINMYIFIVYEQFSVHVNVLYGVYIAQRDILFTICTLGERPIYELRDIPVK